MHQRVIHDHTGNTNFYLENYANIEEEKNTLQTKTQKHVTQNTINSYYPRQE